MVLQTNARAIRSWFDIASDDDHPEPWRSPWRNSPRRGFRRVVKGAFFRTVFSKPDNAPGLHTSIDPSWRQNHAHACLRTGTALGRILSGPSQHPKRTLLGAKGIVTSNKKLQGALGLATRIYTRNKEEHGRTTSIVKRSNSNQPAWPLGQPHGRREDTAGASGRQVVRPS